ncbi:MAG: invasion associated locus B family protein [Alphaproteobacteria bacterium]
MRRAVPVWAVLAAMISAAMALPASAQQTETRQDYALWQLYCAPEPQPDTIACEIRQLLKNSANQFVAGLFYTEVDNLGVFMLRVTPALDDKLKSGVMMQADNGFGTDAFRYIGCDTLGCTTRLPMKQVVVGLIERGNALTMTLGPAAPSPYAVTFQLNGFPEALAALRAR